MQIDPSDASGPNCTQDTAPDHQDADNDSLYEEDLPIFVDWPWSRAALIALVRSPMADLSMSPYSHFIFLSPTTFGLAALEKSEYNIEGLWLIYTHLENIGDIEGLRIEKITRWPTGSAKEQQLTVLHGPNNRMIGIDDKALFDFEKRSTEWNGSGRYKRTDQSEN